ncbi:hypothetical protein ABZZ79_06390 [Streptomyces sp. NPDC006458]
MGVDGAQDLGGATDRRGVRGGDDAERRGVRSGGGAVCGAGAARAAGR